MVLNFSITSHGTFLTLGIELKDNRARFPSLINDFSETCYSFLDTKWSESVSDMKHFNLVVKIIFINKMFAYIGGSADG